MPFDFNNIEQAGREIVTRARRVPKRWAGRVATHAREEAPVLTGYLRDHIVDTSEGGRADEGSCRKPGRILFSSQLRDDPREAHNPTSPTASSEQTPRSATS